LKGTVASSPSRFSTGIRIERCYGSVLILYLNWSLSFECAFSFCPLYFSFILCISQNLFLPWALHTGCVSEQFTPMEALYKCLNTLQYLQQRKICRYIPPYTLHATINLTLLGG